MGTTARKEGTPRLRGSRWTLGVQLFVILTVFALGPLAASSLYGYLSTREHLLETAERNVRTVAALEAANSREFVASKRVLMSSLIAGNEHLLALMGAFQTCDLPCTGVRQQLMNHLGAKVDEGGALVELTAVSPAGEVVASSRGRHLDSAFKSADASKPRRVRDACGIHAGDAGDVFVEHDEDHASTLIMSYPIRRGSDPLGSLCGRFVFEADHVLVRESHSQVRSIVSWFLDEDDHVIFGSRRALARHGAEQARVTRAALARGGRARWHGRYERPGLGEVLGAFEPMPTLGWGVLVEVPVKDTLYELDAIKWQAVGFGILLSGVLLGVALFSAGRLATPLARLAHAARRVSSGALGLTVRPSGPREVFELSHAFNLMSSGVKESQIRLEERVAERTRELASSNAFLSLLLDSVDQHVVVVQEDGVVCMANAAALEAYGHELVGKPYDQCVDGSDAARDAVTEALRQRRRTTREGPREVRERLEVVESEYCPIEGSEGRTDFVVEIARVVSMDKRLQAQLVHQERMATFGLLAAGVAHDIGNPIASVLAQLRMTRERGGEARLRETLDVVEREVRRAQRLLTELVSFARRRRNEGLRVDVNAIIRDVERLLIHDPRARKVDIRLDLWEPTPVVHASEDGIMQVLLNLGINAIDAMPDGGELVLESVLAGDTVRIRVSDTGSGIAPAIQDRLFEPLTSDKPPGRGTGLGLFVSRGIAEDMGGTLSVVKTGPEGSVFELSLPIEPKGGAA